MTISNRYLAKSEPKETISQHTKILEENYRLLKKLYPNLPVNWEILLIAALFHDLGKVNCKFQNKLYRKLKYSLLSDKFPFEEEIPHGNLSPAFLDRERLRKRFTFEELRILYQTIYYHHGRYIPKNKVEYLQNVVKSDLIMYAQGIKLDNQFFNSHPTVNYNKYIRKRIDSINEPDLFYHYVMCKGLLHRLDYAASAHLDVEIPNYDLEEKTIKYLNDQGGLREIQSYLLAHSQENNVVVASTGIGKTEAGLLWIGNNKGFFTLPLRVSINAIYLRIKYDKIGFEKMALLHSDALAFLIAKNDSSDFLKEYNRARLLSMPLTVTTVDQLFKFVFKEERYETVLATLGYSKIIIDEIQMYSPEIVACILMGLKYITKIGGKFSILTATFPKVLDFFMKDLGLKYNYSYFFLNQHRHRIKIEDQDILNSISEIREKGKTEKVLVIVNTVKKAQIIYRQLESVVNKYLLHSRFIKRDRDELETEIMNFSNSRKTGIWITTQIVEASLDIDFDVLYTELSTIDGLFQRMGRCYRKRELTSSSPNINVYTKKCSGVGKFIDEEIFYFSFEALKEYNNKIITENDKSALIEDVYSLEKLQETQYFKSIKKRLHFLQEIPAYEMERAEVESKFRNIKSYTAIPYTIYINNRKEIESNLGELRKLWYGKKNVIRRIQLLEEIKKFTLEVPYYLEKYIKEEITLDRWNRISIIYLEYDEFLGLIEKEIGTNPK